MPFIEVMGFLGRDAEERMTTSNQKVVTITIAENIKKRGQVITLWWRCTIWGDEFNGMVPYFKKGTPLVVRGDLQQPTVYQGNDGTNRVSLDISVKSISFLPSNKQGNPQDGDVKQHGQTKDATSLVGSGQQTTGTQSGSGTSAGGFGFQAGGTSAESEINEDNLPF